MDDYEITDECMKAWRDWHLSGGGFITDEDDIPSVVNPCFEAGFKYGCKVNREAIINDISSKIVESTGWF